MEKATYDIETFQSNEQLQLAEQYIQQTNEHIFLTGKAGTGKTTFLHRLKTVIHKRYVVVAPTGVAAINAKGVTIHSFFQLPFGPFIPGSGESGKRQRKFRKEKQKIIRTLDLLIIDEISMVRADVLDAIDEVLRRYKRNNKPFGGVQLLMIGDIHQLAPVVKEQDWTLLRPHYETAFFFGSQALNKAGCVTIELTQVFRQKDLVFINLLNSVRDNVADQKTFDALNARYKPDTSEEENEGFVTLCTHNYQAQTINDEKLLKLPERLHSFKATISGKFPEHMFPMEKVIQLKIHAQVMFTKNDLAPEKQYFNGKTGRIVAIDKNEVTVKCPDEIDDIIVKPVLWNNYSYEINPETKQIEELVIGSFEQIPLKPAWAITIHKSQGLTFDKAIIDAQKAFAHGQVYVALSRCRSLEGLVLSSPIGKTSIRSDQDVDTFSKEAADNPPTVETLSQAQHRYQQELIVELFSFDKLLISMRQLTALVSKYQSVLVGDIHNMFLSTCNDFDQKAITVSTKFKDQLTFYFDKNNNQDEIHSRIKKAISYFEPALNDTVNAFDKTSIETDNSAVRDEINKSLKETLFNMRKKIICLQACSDGFDQAEYLKARAEADLKVSDIASRQTTKKKITAADTDHPDLYENIRSWRHKKHQELDIPHYRILTQKTVLELSLYLPQTATALKKIHGIGKKTMETYGDEILKIIQSYCSKHSLESPEIPSKPARKKGINPTSEKSFALFQSGQTIDQIAKERDLTAGTVESHLANFIAVGKLNVHDFVKEEKIEIIKNCFAQHGREKLTPIKEILGESYSYSELRFVQQHLNYSENIKAELA